MSATPAVAPAPAQHALLRPTAALVGALVASVLAFGIALLVSVPAANAARDAFNAATPYRCGHAAAPAGTDCWTGVDGRLVSLAVTYSALGTRQAVATVTTAKGVFPVTVEPAPAFSCVSPGAPVVMRTTADSVVTTVFTSYGPLPTVANPNVDPDTRLDGGLALVATGLLIPAGVVLARLQKRRHAGEFAVGAAYRPLVMRLALGAFLLGQAADVVTSAIGHAAGLSEGNSLVDVFVRVTGPFGFLLFRLPAIALVVLGLSQVPRRIAVTALFGVGAVFLAVGGHNAFLAVHAGGSATCTGGFALP